MPDAAARRQVRRRRFLDDLLVTPLHRAIAVAEIDRVAELVGQHLDLDVARVFEEFLQVDHRIAERRLRFGARHRHRVEQRRFGVHHAHAASAAAARGLDDHRIADRARGLDDFLRRIRQRAFAARHARYAGLFHRQLGADLVAHQADRVRLRPDEHEAAFFNALGEVGVFGEEPVPGMYRLGVRNLGGADDGGNIEIALRRQAAGRCIPTRRRASRTSLRRRPPNAPPRS